MPGCAEGHQKWTPRLLKWFVVSQLSCRHLSFHSVLLQKRMYRLDHRYESSRWSQTVSHWCCGSIYSGAPWLPQLCNFAEILNTCPRAVREMSLDPAPITLLPLHIDMVRNEMFHFCLEYHHKLTKSIFFLITASAWPSTFFFWTTYSIVVSHMKVMGRVTESSASHITNLFMSEHSVHWPEMQSALS